ncbi:unnamed protein product [Lactuca virosa]|uniref:Uncharacterized protein n=1 Tax=Lactuca virosa TaxID=75947 RepID=A0AAU9M0W3_9ASTR|nr:unnamed protein product [Lactuca virosa]
MSPYSSDRVMKERLWEVKGCLTRWKEALLVLDWTEEGKGKETSGAAGGLGGCNAGLLKQLLDYLLLLRQWITKGKGKVGLRGSRKQQQVRCRGDAKEAVAFLTVGKLHLQWIFIN